MQPTAINGVVLLDKPKGISSNQALQKVKRHLGAKKAGHTGTLDPMATGMLPICLGEATKLAQYLISDTKSYTFTLKLGQKTDTGDAEGNTVLDIAIPAFDKSQLQTLLSGFLGDSKQYPPMYSAIKKDGKPLYKLARQGIEVEREQRNITIHELELSELTASEITCHVVCSSGTYIRVLAENLAEKLGTVGHLTALHRNYISCFKDKSLVSLVSIKHRDFKVIDVDDVPINLTSLHAPDEIVSRLKYGQRILSTDFDFGDIRGECKIVSKTTLNLVGIGSVYKSKNDNWQLKLYKKINK